MRHEGGLWLIGHIGFRFGGGGARGEGFICGGF